MADLFPKIARLHRFRDLVAVAVGEVPVLVVDDRLQEFIRHAHGVVGVLARDRQISFAVPIGVVNGEVDIFEALARKLDDAPDIVVRHIVAASVLDGSLELRVLGRVEAALVQHAAFGRTILRVAVDARLHDCLQALVTNL